MEGVEGVRFSSLLPRTFKINFFFSPRETPLFKQTYYNSYFLDSLQSFTKFISLSLQGISLVMAFIPKI